MQHVHRTKVLVKRKFYDENMEKIRKTFIWAHPLKENKKTFITQLELPLFIRIMTKSFYFPLFCALLICHMIKVL